MLPRVFATHQREVHVPDLGHVAMLFSPEVFRIVGSELGTERVDA